MEKRASDAISVFLIIAFIALDIFVWHQIFFGKAGGNTRFDFLDVGQGDAVLVTFPSGVTMLVDAGPGYSVTESLEEVLPSTKRYIDLAVISHPQMDHFNGFNDLIKQYTIGAFIVNGRTLHDVPEWDMLHDKIRQTGIPTLRLTAGDRIRNEASVVRVLMPDDNFVESAELNDTSLVLAVSTKDMSALLTGDIGFGVERRLAENHALGSDVLKVAHHGSKFSSSDAFLAAMSPRIAVVQSGARNSYGHPAEETLMRIKDLGNTAVFRNDELGTITITGDGQKIRVFSERRPEDIIKE